jgi:curli production assembly/transport component CsgE
VNYRKNFREPAKYVLPVIILWLVSTIARAGDTSIPTPRAVKPVQLPEQYGGMVTGQLVTVAGNNFFQYFSAFWRDQPLADRYNLTIREKPSVLRGSIIKIDCLNKTVFEATLPNSRGDMKAFSLWAVGTTYQNISQADVQRLLYRDADLGPDEL